MTSQSLLARRSLGAVAALLGLSLAFYGAPAHAQQSETDVLRQQILELQQRLNDLEANQKKTADAAAAATKATANAATAKSPITISGLVQMHGLAYFDDEDASDTFRFRRGELRVRAPRITDKISGSVMFDLAKTGRNRDRSASGSETDAATFGDERNSILQEYIISYDINKSANSSTAIDLGQFKIPLGFEGDQVSSSALQTVERALFFRNFAFSPLDASFLRAGGDQRDQGVRLRGTAGEFAYDLGVFNGLGERQNSPDFDDNKALAGRLAYAPESVQGLNVGVSYATGSVSNAGLDAFGPDFIADVDRSIYNVYAAYQRNKLTLQAEYFNANADVEGQGDVEADSYYGSLGYRFTPKVEGVLRYDVFDGNSGGFILPGDTDAINGEVKETTVGVNYYISGNNAKVQANLVNVKEGDDDNLELRTNFQIAF